MLTFNRTIRDSQTIEDSGFYVTGKVWLSARHLFNFRQDEPNILTVTAEMLNHQCGYLREETNLSNWLSKLFTAERCG